jgi:hypothetical protein
MGDSVFSIFLQTLATLVGLVFFVWLFDGLADSRALWATIAATNNQMYKTAIESLGDVRVFETVDKSGRSQVVLLPGEKPVPIRVYFVTMSLVGGTWSGELSSYERESLFSFNPHPVVEPYLSAGHMPNVVRAVYNTPEQMCILYSRDDFWWRMFQYGIISGGCKSEFLLRNRSMPFVLFSGSVYLDPFNPSPCVCILIIMLIFVTWRVRLHLHS